MAFCNKLTGLLRQGVSQSSNVPAAFMLGSLRHMSNHLLVAGLSSRVDERDLKTAFSRCGEVTKATVIRDKETRESRGFGFVSFTSEDSATNAIKCLHNTDLFGKHIQVSIAYKSGSAPRSFGGGRGGDGRGGDGGGY